MSPGGAHELEDPPLWALVAGWAQRLAAAGPKVWILVVGGLALLVRLPFLFDPHPVVVSDGHGYLSIADNVVHGRGFGDLALLRPPGYPLFLVLVRLLPGGTVHDVVIVQHLLGVALAVAILLTAWQFFGKPAAIIAAVLAAISPQFVAIEHEIVSDYLFALLVFAGTATLAFAVRDSSRRLLMLAGVLFGMATVTKPLGQVLVVIGPLVLVFALWRQWKAILRGTLVVTLSMALVVVPWVVRNQIDSGHAVISSISDQVIFWRVFDGPHPLKIVGDDPDTRLVRELYAGNKPGAPPRGDVWNTLHQLILSGHSEFDAGQRQRAIATRAIRADPGGYLSDAFAFFRGFVTTSGPVGGFYAARDFEPTYRRSIDATPGVLKGSVAALSWPLLRATPWLDVVWWLASILGLSGLLVLRSRDRSRRMAMFTFAATWAILGVAMGLTGLPSLRYFLVGMPFLLIMGSAGIVVFANAVRKWATAGDALPGREGTPGVA